ncbi:hypothetical protein ABCR94_28280 [Streptomyces sp. 21So2-11]|uniref:hypothetical protein n=1 Tax=Streptomyces sp. 21So2-11 TaxID=3144408 RepID=UPI00321BFD50
MSGRIKASTLDGQIQRTFGAPISELYTTAAGPEASPAMTRALELRSFLALAEEQVARVRDRVHEAMAPDRDMGELSAEELRVDAQWLEAALDAGDGYRVALGELLHTLPILHQPPRPVRLAQPTVAAAPPPAIAAPAPRRAGAATTRRP